MSAASKFNGGRCPICKPRFKDRPDSIAKLRPDLIPFYAEDNEYSIEEVGVNSLDKVNWICKNGHRFSSEVHTQNYIEYPAKNVRCPYCAGNIVNKGVNDFESCHPELMDEWDWEVNNKNGIFPDKISRTGSIRIHWICRNNNKHRWETTATIRDRGSGCPFCFRSRQTSSQEVAIHKLLECLGIKSNLRYKLNGLEFDIQSDNPRILIEYHGMAWHDFDVTDMDIEKSKTANEYNYDFIIIREFRDRHRDKNNIILHKGENNINTIYYNIYSNYETLEELLIELRKILETAYSINTKHVNINYSEIIRNAKEYIGIKV